MIKGGGSIEEKKNKSSKSCNKAICFAEVLSKRKLIVNDCDKLHAKFCY